MADDRFGIVVNAREQWANADELLALGVGCVRSIVYDFADLEVALANLAPGVRVIALLNSEHQDIGDDFHGWASAVQELTDRFNGRIWALECINEWDRDSINMPADQVVALTMTAARILRDAGSDIQCLLGSVVSANWVAKLGEAVGLLSQEDRQLLGGVSFHPYLKDAGGVPGHGFGEIDDSVRQAHRIANPAEIVRQPGFKNLPVWVTEFGVMIDEAGGEEGQATYVDNAFTLLGQLPVHILAAATYFCWWDPIGTAEQRGGMAYGLRREDTGNPDANGAPRPAWGRFAIVAGGNGNPVAFSPIPLAPTPA